ARPRPPGLPGLRVLPQRELLAPADGAPRPRDRERVPVTISARLLVALVLGSLLGPGVAAADPDAGPAGPQARGAGSDAVGERRGAGARLSLTVMSLWESGMTPVDPTTGASRPAAAEASPDTLLWGELRGLLDSEGPAGEGVAAHADFRLRL